MNARTVSLCASTLALLTAGARAELPPDGQRIETNQYSIDLFQGPVLASGRVTGLAGAFVAMAEGVDGNNQNPASPAMRDSWSFNRFDYDLGFGLTFPSALRNADFFNSGHYTALPMAGPLDFVFLNLATNLQFGRLGVGASTDLQRYHLSRPSERPNDGTGQERLRGNISVSHLQAAYAFGDGSWLVGVGYRSTQLSVENETPLPGNRRGLFNTSGAGFEAGLVVRPNHRPFRLGVAFRSQVATSPDQATPAGVLRENDDAERLYLPERVTLPWDLNVGFALELGARILNLPWLDPADALEPIYRWYRERQSQRARRRTLAPSEALEAEELLDRSRVELEEQRLKERLRLRYEAMSRSHVLLVGSVLFTGAVQNAVGVESFVERRAATSGRTVSYSPRLAVEAEVVPHWLRLRLGSYMEPNRFASNPQGPRMHVTFGFDQQLFRWNVFGLFPEHTRWRITGSADASRRYFGWGFSIGNWH